jgi:hypothetical protein
MTTILPLEENGEMTIKTMTTHVYSDEGDAKVVVVHRGNNGVDR